MEMILIMRMAMMFTSMMSKKIVIVGGDGFLGGYFRQRLPHALVAQVDISNLSAVKTMLRDQLKPDIVINCAGKTGRPNVDWCEDNKLATLHSNVTGALVLMEQCLLADIAYVHIGSGCIYDNGYFDEKDDPNFKGSFYSKTKLAADILLQDFPVLNLRLRMPFDGSLNPRNLIRKLIGYNKVLTCRNSMTYIPDFINAAVALMDKGLTGTFNIVNESTISPWDIVRLYKEIVDKNHTFEPLSLQDLSSLAKAARSNCELSVEKLTSVGIQMMHVKDAVEIALKEMKRVKG